jgi:hypothetical protein
MAGGVAFGEVRGLGQGTLTLTAGQFADQVRLAFVRECEELLHESWPQSASPAWWAERVNASLLKDWAPFVVKAVNSVQVCSFRVIEKA